MTEPQLNPADTAINPTGTFTETEDLPNSFPFLLNTQFIGPGTDFGSATGTLTPDFSTSGSDPEDSFVFQAPGTALGTLTVTVEGLPVNSSVSVRSTKNTSGASSFAQVGEDGVASLSLVPSLNQRYVVVVQDFSGQGGSYTYDVNLAFADAGPVDTTRGRESFVGERANSVGDISAMESIQSQVDYSGTVGGDDTADFLRFVSPSAGLLRVAVTTAGDAGLLRLVGTDGSVIAEQRLTENFSGPLVFSVEQNTEYYVSVSPADPAGHLDYSMSLVSPPGEGLVEDTVNGVVVGDTDQAYEGAAVIALDGDTAAVTGSLPTSRDFVDAYRFTPAEDGRITLLSMGLGEFTQVFSESAGFVGGFSSLNGSSLGGLDLQVSGGEEYFLSVSSGGATDIPYGIDLTFTAAAEVTGAFTPDAALSDRVDNADTGALLGAAGDASGALFSADIVALDASGARLVVGSVGSADANGVVDSADSLAFYAPGTGTATFSLAATSGAGTLQILDSSGGVLTTSSSAAAGGQLSAEVARGDLYFLSVTASGAGTPLQYELAIDAPGAVSGGERVGSQVLGEVSQAREQAALIPLDATGDAFISGSVGFDGDSADTFTFTPTRSGEAVFDLTNLASVVSVEIATADTLLNVNRFGPDDNLTRVFQTVEAGQQYFVTVQSGTGGAASGFSASEGPTRYELFVSLPAPDASPLSEDTVNGIGIGDAGDWLDTAAVLSLDVTGDARIQGSVTGFSGTDGADAYLFVAPEDGMVNFTMTGLSESMGMYIGAGNQAGASDFDNHRGFIEFEVEAGEEYLLQIYQNSNSEGAKGYVVDVDFERAGAKDFIFSDANNDGIIFDADIITDAGTFISAENTQLYRTYAGVLGRTPDESGFQWWSDQIAQGNHTLQSMVAGFLFSDEFLGFFAEAGAPSEISNDAFVQHMYVNVFGREPDAGGFEFWTGELNTGSRNQAQVVVDMTQSNEFAEQTATAVIDYLM